MIIKTVQISEIQRAKYNPRKALKPGDPAYDRLKKAVSTFGLVEPLVWNSRSKNLVGGHQRLSVIEERGDTAVEVSVVDLDDRQEKALNLALNKQGGEWDYATLADLLTELDAGDLDMGVTGFGVDELEKLMTWTAPNTGFADEDAVPDPPRAPITKPGDLWILGKHRLLCGDSTISEEVCLLIDSSRVGIVFTSPPYLEQREYRTKGKSASWDDLILSAVNIPETVQKKTQIVVNIGLIHRDGEVLRYWDGWLSSMRAAGWKLFGWYVWDKVSATFKANDGRPYIAHEWVFHFNKDPVKTLEWVECKHAGDERSTWGQRKPDGHVAKLSTPGKIKSHRPPDSIARVQRETNNADESIRSHPARFPVSFAEYWLKTWPGIIYEPFSGSGSTLIAAEKLGRPTLAMEIDPAYCDVAVQRWEQFTGKKAVLES